MPRRPRHLIVPSDRSATFHVRTRCTRQLHLLAAPGGRLPGSAADGWVEPADHRKDLLVETVERLLGSMAVEVLAYSVMDNHLHLVLRTHHEAAEAWSDLEVVQRWVRLHPLRDSRDRRRETQPGELERLAADAELVACMRAKLRSLSQFMKELKQHLTQTCNRIEDTVGSMFAGRFDCKRIEDAAALVETMVYVDLNPFRANLCDTPETGRHTSLAKRLEERERASWLTPMDDDPTVRRPQEPIGGAVSGGCRVVAAGLSLASYRLLVTLIASRVRGGKQSLRSRVQEVLTSLELDVERLVAAVRLDPASASG